MSNIIYLEGNGDCVYVDPKIWHGKLLTDLAEQCFLDIFQLLSHYDESEQGPFTVTASDMEAVAYALHRCDKESADGVLIRQGREITSHSDSIWEKCVASYSDAEDCS